MRFPWVRRILAASAIALLGVALASPQQTNVLDEGKRKIKSRVNPQFSELAKRMGIYGKVKVEVVIAADGHVKSSRVIGGHPVLAQSCVDAVSQWKFEPDPTETTQVIEFEFKVQ